MSEEFTVTVGNPVDFVSGDIISLQGCLNDQMNLRCEILSIAGTTLTLRPASLWNLLRDHIRYNLWHPLRRAAEMAWWELADIWGEAKADWLTRN